MLFPHPHFEVTAVATCAILNVINTDEECIRINLILIIFTGLTGKGRRELFLNIFWLFSTNCMSLFEVNYVMNVMIKDTELTAVSSAMAL